MRRSPIHKLKLPMDTDKIAQAMCQWPGRAGKSATPFLLWYQSILSNSSHTRKALLVVDIRPTICKKSAPRLIRASCWKAMLFWILTVMYCCLITGLVLFSYSIIYTILKFNPPSPPPKKKILIHSWSTLNIHRAQLRVMTRHPTATMLQMASFLADIISWHKSTF